MTNELFREVEEDLERQKYEELWKRYGSFIVVTAIGVVLATAGYSGWQNHTMQKHELATGTLADLVGGKTEPSKQIDALEDFAKKNPGQTQATFAQLHAASLAAKDGKNDEAVKIYDEVAGDAKADHAFRQLADLFSVEAQLDNGDPQTLQNRLQPLMASNEPWRYSAAEVSAFLALRAGDKAKAKQLFTDLSQDAGVPQSISARASDMLRLFAE